jgi:EAL domain-containing protein (putative c-di-GMP-specific phosphodiesterase class I)
VNSSEATTTIGVRLLSHRPSVLYKVEHLATEPSEGDIAVEGLRLAGTGWDDRLKTLLQSLSQSERACLFAVRLTDEHALPLPAQTLLDRARTDWFPEFLSHGLMRPHFQPIVEILTGRVFGREALMRGKLGAVEVRGGELLAASEAHDALYSFDYRARAAALEIGLPLLPEGEILFVNVDPRAALDVESSMRTTWPVVDRMSADPARICLEIIRPERCADRVLLESLVDAHRKHGALIALDDLSGSPESLAYLEALKPDFAKIDMALTSGIQFSAGRRALVASLVECAREVDARVVAGGIERVASSRRCATSASTSARATTSVTRQSARWRWTRGSSARGPSSSSWTLAHVTARSSHGPSAHPGFTVAMSAIRSRRAPRWRTPSRASGSRSRTRPPRRPGGCSPSSWRCARAAPCRCPHVHPVQTERFEVVAGTMRFRVGLRTRLAGPG